MVTILGGTESSNPSTESPSLKGAQFRRRTPQLRSGRVHHRSPFRGLAMAKSRAPSTGESRPGRERE